MKFYDLVKKVIIIMSKENSPTNGMYILDSLYYNSCSLINC